MEANTTDAEATIKTPKATTTLIIESAVAIDRTTQGKTAAAVFVTTPALTAISAKTLKRCLSVPTIHTLPGSLGGRCVGSATTMTTRSAAAAAAASATRSIPTSELSLDIPKKYPNIVGESGIHYAHNYSIGIPRSNPSSREVSPAPVFNIFAPRARRYSASNVAAAAGSCSTNAAGAALCLTPRVSQLRQEECADLNSREVSHEREIHNAMQMSQSWEDLTLVAENWSCKSDEFSNPLQVLLTTGMNSCSSPSPTSNRSGLRLPYGLSPSPTRRSFTTRRSMSPIAIRPSPLGSVKRKFDMEDVNVSNWNVYSPPPLKKIFTESRGSSPVCQSPSCPSPDSGTYDGRITPKLFISKLCTTNTTNNNNSSACSSPIAASPSCSSTIDSGATSTLCSSSSSSSSYSTSSSICGGSEPMCVGNNIDEGILISHEKHQSTTNANANVNAPTTLTNNTSMQPMCTDITNDETTLMDDNKSETSSIGGCSSISIESSSCDSGAKAAASFHNRLNIVEEGLMARSGGHKHFFINKQGHSGAKKFVVNHHDNHLPNISGYGLGTALSTNENASSNAESITTTSGCERIDAAATVIDANKITNVQIIPTLSDDNRL